MDKDKAHARQKKYYEAHKDDINDRRKKLRHNWPSAKRENRNPSRGKIYYWAHRDEILKQKRGKKRPAASRLKENLKRLYNLTVEKYQEMLDRQEGGCAICGRIPEYRLRVDHDHDTGAVRGLLCQSCNTGIGQFKDGSSLVAKAYEYLGGEMELPY